MHPLSQYSRKPFGIQSERMITTTSTSWTEGVTCMMNCLYCGKFEVYINLLHGITDMVYTLVMEDTSEDETHQFKDSRESKRLEKINGLFMTSPCSADGGKSPASDVELEGFPYLDSCSTVDYRKSDGIRWLIGNVGCPSGWYSQILGRAKISFGIIITALLYLQKIACYCEDSLSEENMKVESSSLLSNVIYQRRLYRVFMVALIILASKYHQDKHYSNNVWAELTGFPLELINLMERVCLRLLYFDLYVEGDVTYYQDWMHYWLSYASTLSSRRDIANVAAFKGNGEANAKERTPKKKKFSSYFFFGK